MTQGSSHTNAGIKRDRLKVTSRPLSWRWTVYGLRIRASFSEVPAWGHFGLVV